MPQDMSYTPWRPRLDYGDGGDVVSWTAPLPCREFAYEPTSVGGRRIAATGIGASFIVRADELIRVPIRFFESDWSDVLAFIRWGQGEETLTWYPDANDTGTSFEVYLHFPEAGQSIIPRRDAEYARVLEIDLTFRRSAVADPFDLPYHPEP